MKNIWTLDKVKNYQYENCNSQLSHNKSAKGSREVLFFYISFLFRFTKCISGKMTTWDSLSFLLYISRWEPLKMFYMSVYFSCYCCSRHFSFWEINLSGMGSINMTKETWKAVNHWESEVFQSECLLKQILRNTHVLWILSRRK